MAEHFFVIGAQRSGTTYLYHALDRHPEIQMARPVRPEPKFFLDEAQHSGGVVEYVRRYFDPDGPAVRGEKSTSYIESAAAAERIAAAFPGAGIIAVLRDPVDRAVSNYRLTRASGLESRSLDEALGTADRELTSRDGWYEVGGVRISTSPFAYRGRGLYADHLAAWARRFERLRVLLFEDLVASPQPLRSVYRFLGVDDGFEPGALEDGIYPGPADHEPLSAAVAAELRALYAGPNARLAATYGLDLSPWSSGA